MSKLRLQMNLRRRVTVVLALVLSLVACSNIYAPLANKETDEAYLEEALKSLDDQEWDASIAYFAALSPAYRATAAVREKYAGALAGKCGFSFASFLDFMAGADFGSSTFFKVLMNQYTGKAVLPDYCRQAEAQIKSIWTTQSPTQSQKLFIVMLSLSKIGAYLRTKADIDGTGNLGDNSPDAGFNVCTNSSTMLTDDDIKEIVTGFSLTILNITDFLSTFSTSTSGAMAQITLACAAVSPNPCSTTETANVDSGMVATMRDLLNTSSTYTLPIGIGTCTGATLPQNCCP